MLAARAARASLARAARRPAGAEVGPGVLADAQDGVGAIDWVNRLALLPPQPAMISLALAAAMTAPWVQQFGCEPRQSVPLTILRNSVQFPYAEQFGGLQLSGDLLVAVSHRQASPLGGSTGALYLHSRAQGGDWGEPDVVFAESLGATAFRKSNVGEVHYALDGETVFVPIEVQNSTEVVVLERVAGQWTEIQRLTGDPTWEFQPFSGAIGFGFNFSLVADQGRLVISMTRTRLPGSTEFGLLQTLERDASGVWQSVDVSPLAGACGAGDRGMDLDGDRLALLNFTPNGVPNGLATVLEFGPSGWEAIWTTGPPYPDGISVALDGGRVLVGSHYDAFTSVYDVGFGGSVGATAPVQVIRLTDSVLPRMPGGRGPRDYNPPYDSYVEAGSGFAVIGIGDHYDGYGSVSVFEWFQGAYRLMEKTRTPGDVSDVALGGALGGGEAAWFGGFPDPFHQLPGKPRFETWRIDGGRATPYCGTGIDLVATGSGDAPFLDATLTAYGLPSDGHLTFFGGWAAGSTPAGASATLCIDASAGLTRLSAPIAAHADGIVRISTGALEFGSLQPGLVAGATFYLQGLVAGASGVDSTNALKLTLCD
ncbi:hypothetical protein Poly30_53860 [Planctomycetes bacterium Poly30]|uniref:Uncharacterized protein n=1 Tax=Saltatorellus ferox TaxID=2528018 RepID=A0A518F0G0_9BACT|nr:hypothetical protein Poly30_53860 [Planctomycetes bacterium Poly30]